MNRLLMIAMLAFVVSSTSIARACKCAEPGPVKEALKDAAAVFVGKVTDVTLVRGEHRVTLEVSKSWKGTVSKQLSVITPSEGPACGIAFEKGVEYLVYASSKTLPGDANTVLFAHRCSRTSKLGEAKEDLKELGEGKASAQ